MRVWPDNRALVSIGKGSVHRKAAKGASRDTEVYGDPRSLLSRERRLFEEHEEGCGVEDGGWAADEWDCVDIRAGVLWNAARGDGVTTMEVLELRPSDLGTVEMDGLWVPYVDLFDAEFLPTRVRLGAEEYAYHSSQIIFGHGATLPGKIRELRAAGKKPILIERGDRYYVFVAG